ncbi:SGNH/GDSL hydrolase family protein [Arthrobacter halodurans]|uniref:SGNH/GDSL hydrolase family protein n=1 Tax=Arthrobacter halodurans TaxID=516699 RepID=A0ABV4UPQ5_9MICC
MLATGALLGSLVAPVPPPDPSRPGSSPPTVAAGGTALAGAAGTAGSGSAPVAGEHAGWDDSGSTGTVRNPATGRDELVYPAPEGLAVIIGDSQSDGAAGVPGAATWPRLAAEALGFRPVFRGRGGTGFTASRGGHLNYVDALRTQQWLLPRGPVGLVVVQGGGNDARSGAGDAAIRDGALALVSELRAGYPGSPIVLVGTLARSADDGGGRRHAVDGVLRAAAGEAGIPFVSAGDWLTTRGLAARLADEVHLDAEGHRRASGVLLEGLRDLGLQRRDTVLAGAGAEGPAAG